MQRLRIALIIFTVSVGVVMGGYAFFMQGLMAAMGCNSADCWAYALRRMLISFVVFAVTPVACVLFVIRILESKKRTVRWYIITLLWAIIVVILLVIFIDYAKEEFWWLL